MLVHLIATEKSLKDNIENLRLVTKFLQEKGHALTREWIEPAYDNIQKGVATDDSTWQSIVEEDFEALAKADVVIADVTVDSTAVGYQIATAIQQKKPTLLILKEGSKVPPFTWNIPSSFLSRIEYSGDNLVEKLTPFVEENDITVKDMRFNFFIDRKIYNYLRWASHKTGKTKAEVLRELVKNEIEKKP